MKCRIMQQSDETSCGTCGLRWDTNDSDPPPCPNPEPEVRFPDAKVSVFGHGALTVLGGCLDDPVTSCYIVLGPFESTQAAVEASHGLGTHLGKFNKRKNKK